MSDPISPTLPGPGDDWASFRIEAEIGAGGFGRVYSAWDPVLERRVAIKILHGALLDTAARERFLRESKLAGGLDHPRILPIHQAAEHRGLPYIVMRYVDGGDLRGRLRNGPLTVARTVDVITQIASALDRAHRDGLVHRDVKPANILCSEDGDDVYLTDFGITRVVADTTSDLTGTDHPPASPMYAAPEQLLGEPVGPTTDVYSLACTAFECLTGRVPFPGESTLDVTHAQVYDAPPTVTSLRPDLSPAFDDVLAAAMAKVPSDRPRTPIAFAEALAAAAADPPVTHGHRVVVPGPSTSVFDVPATGETLPTAGILDDDPAATWSVPGAGIVSPLPAASSSVPASPTGVVEVDWDGWDEEPPRRGVSALTVAVIAGLLVAVGVVGALVWRAVNVEADLAGDVGAEADGDPDTPTPEPTAGGESEVMAADLEDRVPAEAGDCAPTSGDTTERVQVACVRDGAPDVVTYTLFAVGADRDQAFGDAVANLEIGGDGTGECALGDLGVHAFTGRSGASQVACRAVGRRVDFVWTEGSNLLATAGGEGGFGEQYAFWSSLAGRSDDEFPLGLEQALLDDLPDPVTGSCGRDVDLTIVARGTVAVRCETDGAPDVVSSVRFATTDTMDRWLTDRAESLTGVRDSNDRACQSNRFGRAVEADDDDDGDDGKAPATVGFTDWKIKGETGTVLCFVNSSGTNVVFWTRDDSRIGSIAVSPDSESIDGLLDWWNDEGYRS